MMYVDMCRNNGTKNSSTSDAQNRLAEAEKCHFLLFYCLKIWKFQKVV